MTNAITVKNVQMIDLRVPTSGALLGADPLFVPDLHFSHGQ